MLGDKQITQSTSKLRVIDYDTELGRINLIYKVGMGSFVVFGVDLVALSNSINWYLIFYAIFSIIATVYGCFRLYEGGGGVRASVYGIGAALIFAFFGYRWFSNPETVSKKWPPVINTCPDYLTYVPVNYVITGSKLKGLCVDTIGVTTKGDGIKVLSKSEIQSTKTTRPSDDKKYFPYTSADITPGTSATQLTIICNKCYTMGVTWEGVYDGDTCTAIKTVDAVNARLATCAAAL